MGTAADRWAAQLAGWGIPQEILDAAPESPWFHDPKTFAADGPLPSDSVSARRAREALADGGTVLDVGAGGGRSSLHLAPPATLVTAVDTSEHMLASFAASADRMGVAHGEVLGRWPDAEAVAPVADVVVCHHVLYNVPDVEPFLRALTAHARRRVVVELTVRHPLSGFSAAWRYFWGLERPDGPTDETAEEVARGLGYAVQRERYARPSLAPAATDPHRQVPFVRRRLCLPASRDAEVATYLAEHPLDPPEVVATLWWPGAAS